MNRNALLALIVVLLAGGGVALALSGGDDDDAAPAETQTIPTISAPATTEEESDGKEPEAVSDEQQVEDVVVEYLDQSADGGTVECDLVVDDVCVQNESTIDLSAVGDALGELQVDDVQVEGDRAIAQLDRGGSFQLRQEDGEWRIAGFQPPARDRDATGDGGTEPPERERSGGTEAPDGSGQLEGDRPELPMRVKPEPGSGGAEAP